MTYPHHETALMLLRAGKTSMRLNPGRAEAWLGNPYCDILGIFPAEILAMAAAVDERERRLLDRIDAALAILAFPPNTFEVMPSPRAPLKLLEQDWKLFYDMIFNARAALEDKP